FGYVCARLFAFVLDVGLVSFVVTSLAYSLIAVNPITGLPTNTEGGFDATFALGIAVALLYVWVAEASFGTTLGKLITGLHVYPLRGGPVGLGRALVRGVLRPVDLLIVGGVMALLPGRRRLGDLAGGTIVARSPLHGFAPVIGWIGALVVAGVPVILTGWNKTFLSLLAFYQFLPGIVAHGLALAHDALRLTHLVS
ncbi:MAG TPA: RDD family protein, partial [Candidatus Elarobacter sp.]|nr:RDD family protein [Candidatus Elarobacter sp.]